MDHDREKQNNALTRRIMRRIHIVWGIRMLLRPMTLKLLIAAAFFFQSTEYISYPHVIANAPKLYDIPRDLAFAGGAIVHAESISLFLLAGIIGLIVWSVRDAMHRTQETTWF